MARNGPLITLLGGAALAAVLLGVNVHASTGPTKKSTAAPKATPTAAATAATGTAAAQPPAPSQPSAEPSVSVPANPSQATYAGYTIGGAATLAIAIHDGVVIAYVCDGKKVESWLRGTVSGSQLNLTGTHNGTLSGSFGNGIATGSVSAGGFNWTFKVKAVYKPSGLYRSAAEVRNAKVVGTWIVVNGIQVGVAIDGDVPQPAPELNLNTLTANIDGTTVNAEPVDGATGAGF